jgi:hypothetical protein
MRIEVIGGHLQRALKLWQRVAKENGPATPDLLLQAADQGGRDL